MSPLPEEKVEALAAAVRWVKIGPFGPNALEILTQGGMTHLNGSERDEFARALAPLVAGWLAQERRRADDEEAAKRIASDAADRFRDVLSECLGHPDENPGDDALVAEVRQHFGKTGPEPKRWRDFVAGARAVVDRINAERREDS